MKILKIAILAMVILSGQNSFAQGSKEVEMADVLRQDGKIYTVVFGLVVILTAMIILLIRVDRKISRLEQEQKNNKTE